MIVFSISFALVLRVVSNKHLHTKLLVWGVEEIRLLLE